MAAKMCGCLEAGTSQGGATGGMPSSTCLLARPIQATRKLCQAASLLILVSAPMLAGISSTLSMGTPAMRATRAASTATCTSREPLGGPMPSTASRRVSEAVACTAGDEVLSAQYYKEIRAVRHSRVQDDDLRSV